MTTLTSSPQNMVNHLATVVNDDSAEKCDLQTALKFTTPQFLHCDLVLGNRLAFTTVAPSLGSSLVTFPASLRQAKSMGKVTIRRHAMSPLMAATTSQLSSLNCGHRLRTICSYKLAFSNMESLWEYCNGLFSVFSFLTFNVLSQTHI